MKPGEIREKSSEELNKLAGELEREIFNLRFKKAKGELKQVANIKKVRCDLARVKTELVSRRGA